MNIVALLTPTEIGSASNAKNAARNSRRYLIVSTVWAGTFSDVMTRTHRTASKRRDDALGSKRGDVVSYFSSSAYGRAVSPWPIAATSCRMPRRAWRRRQRNCGRWRRRFNCSGTPRPASCEVRGLATWDDWCGCGMHGLLSSPRHYACRRSGEPRSGFRRLSQRPNRHRRSPTASS